MGAVSRELDGFAARHRSGSAQAATSRQLGLNNGPETVTLQTLPGATGTPTVLFSVSFTTAGTGVSSVNENDGQRITANPASDADYEPHTTANDAQGDSSPGRENDGSPF
ncbi:MAG: hypothetical protein AB7N76_01445 [Planctomycetota bacterium]